MRRVLLLLLTVAPMLGGCYREYVPVMRSTMLVPPRIWYEGRWSRPMACASDRVYFAPGSAEISPETAACLRTKIELLSTPYWFVVGSADHQEAETEEARFDLMRRRGENVVAAFRALGVTSSRWDRVVTVKGGYVLRSALLPATDYHQEYRVVVIY